MRMITFDTLASGLPAGLLAAAQTAPQPLPYQCRLLLDCRGPADYQPADPEGADSPAAAGLRSQTCRPADAGRAQLALRIAEDHPGAEAPLGLDGRSAPALVVAASSQSVTLSPLPGAEAVRAAVLHLRHGDLPSLTLLAPGSAGVDIAEFTCAEAH